MAQTKTVSTLERARDAFVDIKDALETKTGQSLDNVVVEQYDDIIANINPQPSLQTKTVQGDVSTQLSPTPTTYTPDQGYDGFSQFGVTPARLEAEKVITPSNNEQIFDYANDLVYRGARKIRVGAVSSDIDQNIVPANIKKNVNILGVRGNYEGSGGGISLTNLAYFFYHNKRVPADYWDTVVTPNDGNCTDFSYMCRDAHLAAGSYTLDVSGASNIASDQTDHSLIYALYGVIADGVVDIVVRLGANIRSLKNVFQFLSGQSGNYTNLSFDSTGDSYNVVFLKDAFKGTYGTLDLTEIKDNAFTMLAYAFSGVNILTDLIGIEDFDITHVTSLDEMFRGFNESPQYSSGFNELDLSGWDFSNITSVLNMFTYAYFNKVKFDGTSPFDSLKFNAMFQGSKIKNIENLYIKETGLKTASGNVNQSAFENSGELLTITSPAKWVIHNGATKMFNNCQKLTSIPEIDLVIHSNASNKNQMDNMFSNCYALEEVTVNISYADATPQPTYIGSMFSGCRALKEIKGNFDISYVYNAYQFQSTFSGCTALEKIATSGGIAENLAQAITLDLSASAVFDIADFISNLATKVVNQTRNIKLHSTVYSGLSQATIDAATAKGYTLISA